MDAADTYDTETLDELRRRLDPMLEQLGLMRMAKLLGIDRRALERIAFGRSVRVATRALISDRLDLLEAAAAAEGRADAAR